MQNFHGILPRTTNLVGVQREPNPDKREHCFIVSIMWNVVSPNRSFLREGKDAARPTEGGAGMGSGESECRPITGRIRVDALIWATSLDAKAGKLPEGVD